MKTFISDLIPKIQRYSQQLDNLTLLTNQHWVVVDDNNDTKHVYIFRSNNELLISQNGRVEKAKWEYLGHDTLLIDRKEESYLFRHGFFDENVLALKTDGNSEYAFLVNENKFGNRLNSPEHVFEFLQRRYLIQEHKKVINLSSDNSSTNNEPPKTTKYYPGTYQTKRGEIVIHQVESINNAVIGSEVSLDGEPAPDGKYKLQLLWYIHVKGGKLVKESSF